ncbi:small glutamine-rich tetratricopeptide repeat-containing protein alpha [Marchantia polymorpha subsp. ruderalis]|uniref:SGTA homodimerisation domain-containing protein n=2 Tax=Marchantia polymorpha TaxID=3197 RepID=A0AAF6C120_MARPO|nr:hypothetical protein MARPO_0102s0012 [Marchantia polymorpha]BBN17954.1 hypothetical protein Mp_7g18280 [Marchantia polymorpha subsp. ruderalis]|eukprot:PTQ32136.1 hypothetical protein MARPO_0102s0012 [Marchantia polymorpha]
MVSSLRTDSSLSRSIVSSFLQFLSTVEAAPGQDTEGIEVAAQCLAEVFGINNQRPDERIRLISLIDLFNSAGVLHASDIKEHVPSAPTTPAGESSQSSASPSAGPEDELLLNQFNEGLDNAGFFEGTVQGTPEHEEKLKHAMSVLEEARKKVRSSVSAPSWSKYYTEDALVLAEAFKIQGNITLNALQYDTAIHLYTIAITLCRDNAIFHSNRAAALTANGNYEDAIADCHAAMKLDPLYSKAYSRLGLVYYAQGRLQDAIEKGFKKALELDPSSTSVRENLRAAELRLEEQQRTSQSQDSPTQGSSNQTSSSGFNTSSSTNAQIRDQIASLLPGLMNMATQFGQRVAQETQPSAGSNQGPGPNARDQSSGGQSGGGVNDNGAHREESEFRVDTLNGQELPPQYAGLMQSAFERIFGSSQGSQAGSQAGSRAGGWPLGTDVGINSQQGPPGTS